MELIGILIFLIGGFLFWSGLIKPSFIFSKYIKNVTRLKTAAISIPISLFGFIIMITFSQKTEKTENLSKSASYKIVKDEALSNIKRTVEVRLNETLNREDLAIIANEIKKTEKTSFQKTFISYCITKDQCSPYWATTNFNPNLEVLIIGFSADEEIKMKNLKENIEGELIAKWLDDKTKSLLIGYKNNSSFYMKTIYTDNTSSIEEYTWKEVNGSLTLKLKKDNEGEYFIITKDKQLEFWNKERKYDMLLPMK